MNQSHMQAAVFHAAGDPQQVIEVQRIAVPQPQAGEVLVRIEASPVHPADLMFIGGHYRIQPRLPQAAGLEGCGVVVKAGAGVQLAEGTRVAFRHPGCWAEYAAVPADKLFVVPAKVAPEAAAQFALNPVTAWGLLDDSGAQSGDWIAINAASSTVSALVRGLARRRGIRVVSIYRGAPPAGTASAVGSQSADPAAAVLAAAGGEPMGALLDCVGGSAVMRMLPALKPGAAIVSYGVLEREPAAMGNADLIYRNLTWRGFGVDHWLRRNTAQREAMAEGLWAAIAAGDIALPVRSTHGLAQARAAIAGATQGPNTGKALIVPGA
ncbi:2-enoyl thioester reductase domain-containing protein [Ramlibacter sp.]|uniref:MDR family NADPH-dependent oxidoreductase n=1 Tax=Ramlibacter sp. TaxID=1917967 RepID=UPI0017DC9A3E|nr:2-enoyl thioester reductase domain-containing protein [Ramlibacter sp.]MBA2676544.1 zinc-binding dehydrogenase [Ramlibacter sp.]